MASWLKNGVNHQDPQSRRKRWEIEDKRMLRNLKYQLANDGSKEVQYDLGKQLIEDSDDNGDLDRQKQGISYLLKAAEQGHDLALELLGACYRTRRGITSSNEAEIQQFLSMSPGERSAKRAAQELFASLSGGEEFVTVEQLERRMREIYKIQTKKKRKSDSPRECNGDVSLHYRQDEDEGSSSSKSNSPERIQNASRYRDANGDNNNHISEANLVSAAHNYSNGVIPAVNRELAVSVPHPQALDHVPCLHRPFFHPTVFFALLYHRLISIFASFPTDIFTKYQILIVFVVYALSSVKNLADFLPTSLYYLSLVAMVIASFHMFKSKHEFIDFRIWSGLFLSYDQEVNVNDSEILYLRKNLRPFVWFFSAFGVNLMVNSMIDDQWLPHSEITVIAFVLTFMTMFCFMYTSSNVPDILVLFSFGINVLAKYPYELDSVVNSKWRFLDLKIPGFSTYIIGSGIELSMNYRGLLYLMIPVLMLVLAKRRQWQGVIQFLIPHCVTLAWLQIAILSSQSSTTFGLVRSALGLAGVLLFLPLFGLVTLLIPVFAAVEWLSLADTTNRIFVTISTSIIAIVGSCFMAISNRTGKYVTIVQITICVIASCLLFKPYMSSDNNSFYISSHESEKIVKSEQILNVIESDSPTLSWDLYYKYCLSRVESNQILTQIKCSHLDGSPIYWDGTVNRVSIRNVKNWRKKWIEDFLPKFVANQLFCWFGEVNEASCDDDQSCEIKEFLDSNQKCNVDLWNSYEYEIEVKIGSTKGFLNSKTDSIVKIIADHPFGNFTREITADDRIWFHGNMKSSLDEKTLQIDLESIGCIKCSNKDLDSISVRRDLKIENNLKDIRRAFKHLLNVIFNPLVTFK